MGRCKFCDDKLVKWMLKQVQSKVSELIENAGADVIVNLDATHACATNLYLKYFELLMESVPESKRWQVINNLDSNGEMPL